LSRDVNSNQKSVVFIASAVAILYVNQEQIKTLRKRVLPEYLRLSMARCEQRLREVTNARQIHGAKRMPSDVLRDCGEASRIPILAPTEF
jgi:hypothetical protein